jgi:hypothetical protein
MQALEWLGRKFNALKEVALAAWGGISDALALKNFFLRHLDGVGVRSGGDRHECLGRAGSGLGGDSSGAFAVIAHLP